MNSIDFSGSSILVVGGAGFVGSNLVQEIITYDFRELLIVDNLLSSDISNVPQHPRIKFIFGSITDDQVLANLPNDLDYVFHLACFHGNQSSINDPIEDHANNNITSLKLFNTLKGFSKLKKVVYAAAGCAVAEKTFSEAAATSEDAPVSLYHDSPYSISKLVGELYGNFFWKQYDFPFVKARFQNVYGPGEILGAGRWRGTQHTVWRNVTPSFIWKSLNKEALPLDNGGDASRDFIFVEDMAKGLICCAAKGVPGEVYNLASGVETAIKDMAELINELTNNQTPVNLKPARDWDRSGKRFGSTEKSEKMIGFKAQVSIRKGLERTIEWTRKNREIIERCIHQHDYFMRNSKG